LSNSVAGRESGSLFRPSCSSLCINLSSIKLEI
jgi:hypothetical protein